MSSIGPVFKVSETHFIAISGKEDFHPRLIRFFRDYFSEENPRDKRSFCLKDKGEYYLVALRLEEANQGNSDRFYGVRVIPYELALRIYRGAPKSKERFIEDLEEMQKIPREKLRSLDPPLQGFECKGIPFFYSREFQLQMEGQKSGSHHVSLGDHFISEEILEAVLVNTAEYINRKKNKPLGVVTRHFLVDGPKGSKVLAFIFARNPNSSCTIFSMFYPARSFLKQDHSEVQYNAWLKNLPKINL